QHHKIQVNSLHNGTNWKNIPTIPKEILQDNEFINAWEIIKETNKSEPWTNFDTYEEYITQTKKQSTVRILKAKEYFAKKLIKMIIKNWKYDKLENKNKTRKKQMFTTLFSTLKTRQLREKLNNIFDKLSKEGILKTLNQDPYTSKLIPIRVQLLTGYKVKLAKAKLPLNKSYELTNI
ncbi:20829_t:CDS:2, partial [Gigaspora margarita]